ncbi:MAG: hypothetical protein U5Q03_03380 [Bacteroidota bacterium]|nr:hypothetical protein [Bacteroidota bacterium]
MKKLVTLMIAIVIVVGFSSESKAQLNLGVTAGIALPMGDWSDGYDMGFGGMLEGDYFVKENIAIGLNVGYYIFSGKTETISGVDIDYPNFSIIPVFAKGDYYFATEGFMPYGGIGLGMFMASTEDYETTISYGTYTKKVTVEGASDTKFGFSPHVGFLTGEGFKIGAEVAYTIIENANHLNASVRLLFPLGN